MYSRYWTYSAPKRRGRRYSTLPEMEVMNILSYDFGAFLLWNYMFFLVGVNIWDRCVEGKSTSMILETIELPLSINSNGKDNRRWVSHPQSAEIRATPVNPQPPSTQLNETMWQIAQGWYVCAGCMLDFFSLTVSIVQVKPVTILVIGWLDLGWSTRFGHVMQRTSVHST